MKKTNSKPGLKKGAPPKDVDAYLASVPPDMRAVLQKLRNTIKSAAPQAEEVISYQMPAYKYKGVLVYFAAFKNHCSLFPASKSILKIFENELKRFEASGATIHFTVEQPLPATLVRKIVKARIKQNEERHKK
ncbi:MAG TPA: hypothetical protein DEO84_05525 [candidate division Zixibacteria bacterium]|nr:hypothetical protein [candidate division Zixibacteria bacterium]